MNQILKMNESNINAGLLSKMGPERMAEQLSKLTLWVLGAQEKKIYDVLMGGGRADVKGYGKDVNIAEIHNKNASMLSKVVEKSSAWGTGLSDFWQYAGAPTQIKGWDVGSSLAYAGTMMDVGFKGSQDRQ